MESGDDLKRRVQQYWDHTPCESWGIDFPEGSLEFFEEVEERRYTGQDQIHAFAQFTRWHDKRVLEIDVGLGTDFLQFVRAHGGLPSRRLLWFLAVALDSLLSRRPALATSLILKMTK